MNEQGTALPATEAPVTDGEIPTTETTPVPPEKPTRRIMTRARNKIEGELKTAKMLATAAYNGNKQGLAERYSHIVEVLEWVLDRALDRPPTTLAHLADICEEQVS